MLVHYINKGGIIELQRVTQLSTTNKVELIENISLKQNPAPLKNPQLTKWGQQNIIGRGEVYKHHLATRTNRLGPVFRKLQENSKRGLHFRSFYQFKILTIVTESYHEAAESNQMRLLWLRKRHKVEK